MWRTLEEKRIRSHYLPHFVEIDGVRKTAPYGGPPEVLIVGSVIRDEEARVLFEALRLVHRAVEGVILRWIGNGANSSRLRELAKRENMEDVVVFHDHLSDADLEKRLVRSNVVVFPSLAKESCPPILLESMAYARPVVAYRIGGIPELIEDGENGFLAWPGESIGLVKAIVNVLMDGDRAREMGEKGKWRIMSRFSGERHIHEVVKIYRELLWGR
jgi:glycosyltransferase involved in cell wall biosynthesis